jgi:putative hemolysin
MEPAPLTYATSRDSLLKRWTMRTIENLSGRRRLLPIYHAWRIKVRSDSDCMMGELLGVMGTRLDINVDHASDADTGSWPVTVPPGMPLVIVANHPFGVGDGIAVLALAEQLGRPYRILANSDFVKIPEIRHRVLPIDFSGSREAIKTNLESRKQARQLLRGGVTIVVFPAGGVATAEHPAGKAEELPWKTFTARLIQHARAAVLPVYFQGQNSPLFHLASRYSLTVRLALMVTELRHVVGATIEAHVGAAIPFDDLVWKADPEQLTAELYSRVHRLAPEERHRSLDQIRQRPVEQRRRYPWDPPQGSKSATARTQRRARTEVLPFDPWQKNFRKSRFVFFRRRVNPSHVHKEVRAR